MAGSGLIQGRITDEEIARVRSRIGNVIYAYRYNEVATKDAIRHFTDGIGDDNPLWRDESYASKTRYGMIIAPPLFLYSVNVPGGGGGFPGVHGFHAGNDWEFFRPIHVNDTITFETWVSDLLEKARSEYAGRTVIVYTEGIYRNQRNETIAKVKGWSVRAERKAGKEKGKYAGITSYSYTPEELKAIEDDYDAEIIRGATPRYWEETDVGEALVPVVKGPLNMTDLHAFVAGTLGAGINGRGGAHKFGLLYRRRHPAWARVDPETGAIDTPERVHARSDYSREIGIPMAYDYGPQRVSWLGHLLTNWMGDSGFIIRLYVEIRRFNMLGDTTWCKGNVTRKYIEGEDHLVDIKIWAENQRKEITAPGHATIILPSRSRKLFDKQD